MSTKEFDKAVDFPEEFHANWSKSEEVPIPDTLAQALGALTITTPTRTLIGNYITAHSINKSHIIGELIFSLIDRS